ncbi:MULTISPECIES: MipA/OmpV family protein [Marinobacter]|uniref:MipA/OmpV family protein n=1 Tax=Marinobacter TaxID=2742 RepID=UPI001247EF6C|nr:MULTISPECIES: MipA/OmpV family protein [Marinobacter]
MLALALTQVALTARASGLLQVSSIRCRMSPSWSLTGIVGMTYLTGDAKDSPIVEDIGSATQAFGGALINYRF